MERKNNTENQNLGLKADQCVDQKHMKQWKILINIKKIKVLQNIFSMKMS